MTDNQFTFVKGLETIYEFSKKEKNSLPPVDKWNPDFCGDIDMRIMRNGKWFYMGSEIKRPAMIKLFSRILRLDEDNQYYLVTPVEKVRIQVEDAPFVATSIHQETKNGVKNLYFTTNLNEKILKGNDVKITTNFNKEKSDQFFFSSGIFNLNNKEFAGKDTKILLHKTIFDKEKEKFLAL